MNIEGQTKALAAKSKLTSGALMTIDEVAATLAISPQTVHTLPLESVRIGRLLRFDPRDVRRLIASSKEKTLPTFSLKEE